MGIIKNKEKTKIWVNLKVHQHLLEEVKWRKTMQNASCLSQVTQFKVLSNLIFSNHTKHIVLQSGFVPTERFISITTMVKRSVRGNLFIQEKYSNNLILMDTIRLLIRRRS